MLHYPVRLCYLLISLLVFCSCSGPAKQEAASLFTLINPTESGVTFSNDLTFSQDVNIYRYRNFYNGGGVAIGDINNDGLADLYFTANMKKNRLYINEGDVTFRDITASAGVGGRRAWSTGVSMVDVNGDGLLDIYVCNSGIVDGDDKRNELYINNGDETFTEQAAAYGIDDPALSIHATFFDYDGDGDLDMYLVNNSYRAIGSFDQEQDMRGTRNAQGGDKLYRNDGDHFTDVSAEANIYGSETGFGLGASAGDLNRDGWPDLYISNDFFERDYLYINNRDGTFREVLEEQMKSISATAMGADVGDLNNDGYPDLFVTDMLPESEARLKRITLFDSWERYRQYVADDFYHQFTRNTLQLNNGNGTFSEIGRYAGVAATDWSWGANIADFDMDGTRDIFVANGMLQDITNIDYLQHVSQEDVVRRIVRDSTVNYQELIDIIPSTPIPNYAFRGTGNLKFENSATAWGLDLPGFSNGSAYGDLDNDGDLELVINNINSSASIYKSYASERETGHWLMVDLRMEGPNPFAVGTQVTAWADGKQWFAEQIPVRGFQSTVDHRLHFGLGTVAMLDSLIVRWPDGRYASMVDVAANHMVSLTRDTLQPMPRVRLAEKRNREQKGFLTDITAQAGISWRHRERRGDDFDRDPLLHHMRSTEGPPLCIGDANGDGREDFYAGGARDQAGVLFMQRINGTFTSVQDALFQADAASEDISCVWFDANGDGAEDLYVASGSNEFPASSSSLADRLYLNDGRGAFTPSDLGIESWRYKTAGVVAAADFDGDGDMDLFLGVRLQPFGIGLPTSSFLLENDGSGHFRDVTATKALALQNIGMVTDASWGDIDGDGTADLVIAREWMPIAVLFNTNGSLRMSETATYPAGWWKMAALKDVDGDGDVDLLAGNIGANTKFRASAQHPMEIWVNDFDGNGQIEHVIGLFKEDALYPMALRHDLIDQIPPLESRYPDYESFAGQSIADIFTENQLSTGFHYEITEVRSIVGINDGSGTFTVQPLPFRAQLAPIFAAETIEKEGDDTPVLIAAGNMTSVTPQAGPYASSYGTALHWKGRQMQDITEQLHLSLDGEIREIKKITLNAGRTGILIARNDRSIRLYEITP